MKKRVISSKIPPDGTLELLSPEMETTIANPHIDGDHLASDASSSSSQKYKSDFEKSSDSGSNPDVAASSTSSASNPEDRLSHHTPMACLDIPEQFVGAFQQFLDQNFQKAEKHKSGIVRETGGPLILKLCAKDSADLLQNYQQQKRDYELLRIDYNIGIISSEFSKDRFEEALKKFEEVTECDKLSDKAISWQEIMIPTLENEIYSQHAESGKLRQPAFQKAERDISLLVIGYNHQDATAAGKVLEQIESLPEEQKANFVLFIEGLYSFQQNLLEREDTEALELVLKTSSAQSQPMTDLVLGTINQGAKVQGINVNLGTDNDFNNNKIEAVENRTTQGDLFFAYCMQRHLNKNPNISKTICFVGSKHVDGVRDIMSQYCSSVSTQEIIFEKEFETAQPESWVDKVEERRKSPTTEEGRKL